MTLGVVEELKTWIYNNVFCAISYTFLAISFLFFAHVLMLDNAVIHNCNNFDGVFGILIRVGNVRYTKRYVHKYNHKIALEN